MKFLLEKIVSCVIDLLDKYIHMRKLSNYLIQHNFQKETIVLDVGTHKGEYVDFFLRLNKNFKIYSFEPQKNQFERLKFKYKNENNIFLNNIGIGEKKNYLEMKINIKSSTSTFSKINYSSNYLKFKSKILGTSTDKMYYMKEKVSMQTIDNFIFENNLKNIGILKICAMGFENKVLNGAKKSLSKINVILIGFHSHDMYLDYDSEQAHNFLIENNFVLSQSFKFPFMNWEHRAYINKSLIEKK